MRVMPNIPALARSGASVYVRGKGATTEDCTLTQALFEAIGTCEEVPENLIDPITALSGSGPAYVFVLIEALADGAVRMGLPRDLAYRLASQTVLGSGKLVRESGRQPGQLKDDVTSPAGSTAAGLAFLEQNGKSMTLHRKSELARYILLQHSDMRWPEPWKLRHFDVVKFRAINRIYDIPSLALSWLL